MAFEKLISNPYIDQGGSTILTYILINNTVGPIISACITDTLLTKSALTVSNLKGGIMNHHEITMTLPAGGLKVNEMAVVTLTLTAGKMIKTSSKDYTTEAKVKHIALSDITHLEVVETETDSEMLQVNSAVLEITLTVIPQARVVQSGTYMQYTISICNKGNKTATIGNREFISQWTQTHLKNVTLSNESRFAILKNSIVNRGNLLIEPEETVTLVISGIATA